MAVNKNKITALAQKYTAKGQFEKAIGEYKKLLKVDPNDIRTWLKMGDLYSRMGARTEATQTYLKVAEYYRNNDFHLKAVAVYKQILKIDPTFVQVIEMLADAYLSLGLTSDALIQLEQAADMCQNMSRFDEMLKVLSNMAEIDPQNISTRLRIAEHLSQSGDTQGAIEQFSIVCDELRSQGRVDDFIKVAERLLYHDSTNIEIAKEVAAAYLNRGQPKRALAKLQLCFASEPKNLETLELLAKAFVDLEQPEKAISVYSEIVLLLEGQNKEPERIHFLKVILSLDPQNEKALSELSGSRFSNIPNRMSQSPSSLGLPSPADALSNAPMELPTDTVENYALSDEEAELKARSIIDEADVYLKYRRTEQAVEHIQKVFSFDYFNMEAREKLKDIFLQEGNVPAAIAQLFILAEGFVETQPEGAVYFLHEILKIVPNDENARGMLLAIGGTLPDSLSENATELVGENASHSIPDEASFAQFEVDAEDGLLEGDVVPLDAEFDDAPIDAVDLDTEIKGDLSAGMISELEDSAAIEAMFEDSQGDIPVPVDDDEIVFGEDEDIEDVEDEPIELMVSADAEIVDLEPEPGEFEDVEEVEEVEEVADSPTNGTPLPLEMEPIQSVEIASTGMESAEFSEISEESPAGDSAAWDGRPLDDRKAEDVNNETDADFEEVTAAGDANAEVKVAPQEMVPDLSEEVEEIEFYADQGLVEEAKNIYSNLAQKYPSNAQLNALYLRLFAADERTGETQAASATLDEVGQVEVVDEDNRDHGTSSLKVTVGNDAAFSVEETDHAEVVDSVMVDESAFRKSVVEDLEAVPIDDAPPAALVKQSEIEENVVDDDIAVDEDFVVEEPTDGIGDVQFEDDAMAVESESFQEDDISLGDDSGYPDEFEDDATLPPVVPYSEEDSGLLQLAPEPSMDSADSLVPTFESGPGVDDGFFDETDFSGLDSEIPKAEEPSQSKEGNGGIKKVVVQFKEGNISNDDFSTHYDLGVAYKEMGLFSNAISEFEIAKAASHLLVSCETMIGICQIGMGAPQKAIDTLWEALELPNIDEAGRLALRYELGKAYEICNQKLEAVKVYNQILKEDPGFADVLQRIDTLTD